jgi:hypothetical protein
LDRLGPIPGQDQRGLVNLVDGNGFLFGATTGIVQIHNFHYDKHINNDIGANELAKTHPNQS